MGFDWLGSCLVNRVEGTVFGLFEVEMSFALRCGLYKGGCAFEFYKAVNMHITGNTSQNH